MSGAIRPLPNTPSWRGDQLKKSTGTTLSLPLPYLIALNYKTSKRPGVIEANMCNLRAGIAQTV
jgi:hypothetical protein